MDASCAGWPWATRTTTAAGADAAPRVDALLYSLLETAKLRGVGPKRYLREATLAAPRGELLPLSPQLAHSGEG
jgi:hypothetical protein